ncbi:hypothetical protein [Flexivirga meconopsidis]|uniref:hypothetical protein n=1 Tax=Flexivirga meconopsidis TaxID=2977121 RepID=UPI00223FF505|nr:hypothetical protein [Flexivirga meconopsidis]
MHTSTESDPGATASGEPGWQQLAGAMLWRARTEGFASIFAYPIGMIAMAVVIGVVTFNAPRENVPSFPSGGPYGTTADGLPMQLALMMAPALLVLAVTIGTGRMVQSVVGSESATGTFEMLLAQGFRPRQLATAVIVLVACGTALLWVAATVTVTVLLLVLDSLADAHTQLSPGYATLLVAMPLLVAASGGFLSIALGFSSPTLTQPAQQGMVSGTGNLVGTIATLPGLIMLIAVVSVSGLGWGTTVVLGLTAGLTVLICGASIWIMTHRFGYEGVLRSV